MENFDIQANTNSVTKRIFMLVKENKWKVRMREIVPIMCHVIIKGLRLGGKGHEIRKEMSSLKNPQKYGQGGPRTQNGDATNCSSTKLPHLTRTAR